jgi:hypothetical protein
MTQRAMSNIVEQSGNSEEEHEVLVRFEIPKGVYDFLVVNSVGFLKGLTRRSCLADFLLIIQDCIQKFTREVHHSDTVIESSMVRRGEY